MLIARRDPPFHVDADGAPPVHPEPYRPLKASGFTRFIAAVQMIGSLLAVPVGIASAYSFYRANFSPETTCQTLRSGIISLLDKSVDAATRRTLVRRDVETFEKTCAAVDPEATAAFKTLLTAEKPAAPPAAASVATETAPSHPKEAVRKIEPRPAAAKPAAATQSAVVEPMRRDAVVSDSQWLDAVRQALVTHKPESSAAPVSKPQTAINPVPRPAPEGTTASTSATVPAPASAPTAAPALPPAITVTPPPVQRADADHPVPPQSIPDPDSPAPAEVAKPDEHGRSRIGKWISSIPLLGNVVDNARN